MNNLIIGMPESGTQEEVTASRNYINAVRRGGHVPLILPYTEEETEAEMQLKSIDLLLLLGGGDVEAYRYGNTPLDTDGQPNRERDEHELLLFSLACKKRIPVVGICRGMQVINIGLGGTLCQDIPSQWINVTINHSRADSKWHPVHDIDIQKDSRLFQVLGASHVSVNSTHHQAVGVLGDGLVATATSDDGIIEAIESVRLPVAGVQFHPERLAWGDDKVFTRLFCNMAKFAGALKILLALLLMSIVPCASFAEQDEMPVDFVYMSKVAPDIMQEIRYYTTYNFVGNRIPGYEAAEAILVKVAADSLIAVNNELMQLGYRIKIMDAYRPQRAVDYFVRWALRGEDQKMKRYFYPDCPKSELFKRGYLARRSGHSRGATVDVTLFDMKTGKDVDMGSPYDLLGEQSHFSYIQGLSPQQIEMRKLLRSVMKKHGFKPIHCEWWHFTLIDEPYPFQTFDFLIR